MRAFGSYAGRQVIDFGELGAHRCFLIHGPIGSGKSTVLDAICFSLYGSASGDNRSPELMRSDHANLHTHTEVTLDFAIGPERYRVTRSPKQERPRKRGTGTVVVNASATLWRRTHVEDPDDEGEVLAHQSRAVTEHVETLLGFRLEQFRQVVILPQGQFRRLLTARSADRQAIMETLFQTELYRQIEHRLKAQAKESTSLLQNMRAQRMLILEQAGVDSERALVAHKETLGGELLEAQRHRQAISARVEEARTQEARGRAAQEVLRQHDLRVRELTALQAQEPAFDLKRQELDAASRAATIDGDAHLAARLQNEAALAVSRRDAAHLQLEAAQEALAGAQRSLDDITLREKEGDRLRARLNELDQLEGRVALLRDARVALDSASSARQRAEKALNDAGAALAALTTRLETLERARRDAEAVAANLSRLDDALRALREDIALLTERKTISVNLQEAQRELDAAEVTLTHMDDTLRQEREELMLIEAAWAGGQAAILAASLKADAPCPVCGSASHPAPATSEGALPSARTLERKRERLQQLQRERDTARDAAEGLRITRTQANEALARIDARLPEGADLDDAARQLRQLCEAQSAAAEAQRVLTALADEQQALEADRDAQRMAMEGLRAARDEAVARHTRCQIVVQEREASLPETLREPEVLAQARREAQARLDQLNAERESAQRAAQEAQQRVTTARAEWDAAQGAVQQTQQLSEDAQRVLQRSLAEASFQDLAQYEIARRAPEQIKRLNDEISDHEGQLKAALREVERTSALVEGLTPPDMSALQKAVEDSDLALTNAIQHATSLQERHELAQGRLSMLTDINERLTALEARYSVIGRLADVATGRNELRMTFQRFVLTALLDEVLACASRRLRVMSNQRYDLRRAHDPTDRRAAGGLELEVRDSYTGTYRNVITLSGGESFLAALSLALGLADVVQRYAGGIHLEAIFIDEGFGSLDAEALDLALNALLDLRAGGRIVGIISHVAELRERIQARLEITRGAQGSAAAFHV